MSQTRPTQPSYVLLGLVSLALLFVAVIFSGIAAFRDNCESTFIYGNAGLDSSPSVISQADPSRFVPVGSNQRLTSGTATGDDQLLVVSWPWELSSAVRNQCSGVKALERFALSDFCLTSVVTPGGSDVSLSTIPIRSRDVFEHRGSKVSDLLGTILGKMSLMLVTSQTMDLTNVESSDLRRWLTCRPATGEPSSSPGRASCRDCGAPFDRLIIPALESDAGVRLRSFAGEEEFGPCVVAEERYSDIYQRLSGLSTENATAPGNSDLFIVPFPFVAHLYVRHSVVIEDMSVFVRRPGTTFKDLELDGKKFFDIGYKLANDVWIYTRQYYLKQSVQKYVDCLYSRINSLESSVLTHVNRLPVIERIVFVPSTTE